MFVAIQFVPCYQFTLKILYDHGINYFLCKTVILLCTHFYHVLISSQLKRLLVFIGRIFKYRSTSSRTSKNSSFLFSHLYLVYKVEKLNFIRVYSVDVLSSLERV